MEWLSGDFSKIIGKSQMQISRYRKDGMPSIQKGKNYYFNYDSIRWLFKTGIEQVERDIDSEDVELLPARERKDLADAKNKEFDLAVKMGKFLDKNEVKSYSVNLGIRIREEISNIPDKFIPRLEINKNMTIEEIKHYLRVELKEEIYQTLIRLRDMKKG